MLKRLWQILFCEHQYETSMSFLDSDGNEHALGFCCECGILRYYERFKKGEPPISRRDNTIRTDGKAVKYIEKYPLGHKRDVFIE
ncbi:MAG TPA: hypothetical protein DDW84_00240 [Phycisphaerales bacterium]|nr:MAG: hypothetical protein A2Y13_01915 [Planctomycetes bacterium GWC2_45_44]HBG77266.1 hypothetical protein [Phycisphaerales bacterium]HBR19177.1 hypothetical protein [Phycisphaerales bacterium]